MFLIKSNKNKPIPFNNPFLPKMCFHSCKKFEETNVLFLIICKYNEVIFSLKFSLKVKKVGGLKFIKYVLNAIFKIFNRN